MLAMEFTESPIEAMLFKEMMKSGVFVLCRDEDNPTGEGLFIFPQKVVGKYRADFIIRGMGYKPQTRVWPPNIQSTIAVECDGYDFHSSQEQKDYDKNRDAYFLENGIKTIRFTGKEIHKDARRCVNQIENHIRMDMIGAYGGLS